MGTIFFVIFLLAIFHFIYEGILAPSFRHNLRYKYFALRDELRSIKVEGGLSKKDASIYELLDDSLCYMIKSMAFLEISNYFKWRKMAKDEPNLLQKANKVSELIKSADNKRLTEIDSEINKLASKAMLINNGALLLYLIPFLLLLVVISLIFSGINKIKSVLFGMASSLIYSPISSRDRIVPIYIS